MAENWPQINPVVLDALVAERDALRAAVRRVRELPADFVSQDGTGYVMWERVRDALVEPPAEPAEVGHEFRPDFGIDDEDGHLRDRRVLHRPVP